MHKFYWLPFLIFFSTNTLATAADIVVAINSQNESTITEKDILKILKAETLVWNDQKAVILLIDELKSINGDNFTHVTHMRKSQFIEFWRIKFFSGRALLPKQVQNSSKALTILLENKNSIYIHFEKNIPKELASDKNIKTIQFSFD